MARQALSGTRTIDILNFLVAHPGESFTLSEIAKRLGINLASAHAVLGVMTDAGYLVRHPTQRAYSLGPLLVAVGRAAAERHPVLAVAESLGGELAEELGLECLVVAPTSTEMVVVGQTGRPRPLGMHTDVGHRVPMVPPLGAVFFAWADDEQVQEWLDRAPEAPAHARRHDTEILRAVRERGFSVGLADPARRGMKVALDELDELPRSRSARGALASSIGQLTRPDTVLGSLADSARYHVAHVAAPVFDPYQQVQLGVYLLGFRTPLSTPELLSIGARLVDAGLAVTRLAGGRAPTPVPAPARARAPRRAAASGRSARSDVDGA